MTNQAYKIPAEQVKSAQDMGVTVSVFGYAYVKNNKNVDFSTVKGCDMQLHTEESYCYECSGGMGDGFMAYANSCVCEH